MVDNAWGLLPVARWGIRAADRIHQRRVACGWANRYRATVRMSDHVASCVRPAWPPIGSARGDGYRGWNEVLTIDAVGERPHTLALDTFVDFFVELI